MNKQTTRELDNQLRDKSLYWWTNLGRENMSKMRDKYYRNRQELTADERLHIYLSENPQTETKVEDVQPTEEIERHARLIENADAMYSALKEILDDDKQFGTLQAVHRVKVKNLLNQIDNK